MLNLGGFHGDKGRYEAAEQLQRQALNIWEKAPGPEEESMVRALNSLGSMFTARGNYSKARVLLDRAMAICDKERSVGPMLAAATLENLGTLRNRD